MSITSLLKLANCFADHLDSSWADDKSEEDVDQLLLTKILGVVEEACEGEINPLLKQEMISRYFQSEELGMTSREKVWSVMQALIFWPQDIRPIRNALENFLVTLPREPASGASLPTNPNPPWRPR